ncbi:MAG TPA: hypothetical protein VK465_10905, partial [Fibrobacteria bacterium]|nr:hypothetical protein [Fibrobacteria bacterium]
RCFSIVQVATGPISGQNYRAENGKTRLVLHIKTPNIACFLSIVFHFRETTEMDRPNETDRSKNGQGEELGYGDFAQRIRVSIDKRVYRRRSQQGREFKRKTFPRRKRKKQNGSP